ncbi:potential Arf GTPase-activating protein [Pseudozyma hubeiensis SY62]|uniref:Potential Arf GTPase-activating protein n=1 Tax=Pseudozyma hubeiensis (strain SY62) TaxID=1305764 RepID=R9P169_PSEHS|nr:potential Arf GTPase-activating protein [Pseudozyma hubeiensis SY62]GAC94961.1 potential Arf GTPase-activating protein [Pseudozyma hubeiensis SY62]
MSRVTQSRQQTEANAKLLRSLAKSADNKVCVDCKKNDPRWASWNLGCFLCIRCSGIHRSMGTHISKVKSIDLDIWTPEQMDSVQKWGNRRCNLYWEAHLKAGHVPADHKIESFIRSKYESRRWAKDGPPPSDPSVLDGGAEAPAATASGSTGAATAKATPSVAAKKAAPAIDLLDDASPAPAPAPAASATKQPPAPATTAAPPKTTPAGGGGGGGGIFDLDWHEPSPSSTTTTTSKGKNDIMSLFASSKPTPAPAPSTANDTFGDFSSFTSPTSTTAAAAAATSNLTSSFGGLDLSAAPKSTAPAFGASSNPWSTGTNPPAPSNTAGGLFDTHDVWGSSGANTTSSKPKDDAFADIWGDFK